MSWGESQVRDASCDSPLIETRNDGGPLSTMGRGEKDCDGTDGTDSHGHGHGGDAHAHGHSHGDAGGDATPLIQDGEGKDGIVYYRAPDGRVLHSHDGLKPHSHDPIPSPGHFERRRPRKERGDYDERAFTVGIGGPVGTGKTALMLQLCRHFTKESRDICAVTNDIFTREDGEFLTRHEALEAGRIRAVETGGCPHAAIREDISCNLTEVENLTREYSPEFVLLESGGDNLAANFSRELADYIIYVIDVCGGDKIPRKGGPGVTQADLLVINKTELAERWARRWRRWRATARSRETPDRS